MHIIPPHIASARMPQECRKNAARVPHEYKNIPASRNNFRSRGAEQHSTVYLNSDTLTGNSCPAGISYLTGDFRPAGISYPAGDSRPAGISSPAGSSHLTGNSHAPL